MDSKNVIKNHKAQSKAKKIVLLGAYVLAVPDQKDWEFQINKIPTRIKNMLNMECFLVSKTGVRKA